MILSFRSKALAKLWDSNDGSKIRPDLLERVRLRLDVIHRAKSLDQMNVPGFDFHRLQGKPVRHSVHVNGPWCVTFEWDGQDAVRLELEQDH